MHPVVGATPRRLARTEPGRTDSKGTTPADRVPLWRLYALRVGYLIIAVGLAVTRWPVLVNHAQPWPLMDSVVVCMLVAMSLLALLGIRYPVQMLPLLLFETAWKLIWLAVVALPLWTADRMDPATWETTFACLWVVIVLAVIPWRHVITHYVTKPGDRWRPVHADSGR
ncbi:hypothetical protein [Georgenia sp. AZ-5]|uniref:hypothetical protein n=1 Tax=Georgenia sp. AZ-5 TaxID=3367526 RepID=UPI0037540578